MSFSEFDIISTFFNQPGLSPDSEQSQNLPLAIGDDCALLDIPVDKQLAVSMDVLVADVHFPLTGDANLIAQKALAVNLSDLAAMGATPLAFTLGLMLPSVDEQWLSGFSEGLRHSASKYACPLIGGDMSKGSLAISIQVHGLIDKGCALRRNGAKVGDKVYVTGSLGEAGLALLYFKGQLSDISSATKERILQAYYKPSPRLKAGQLSIQYANAAIDISDGLLADLGHIAQQSKVKIIVELDKVPLSENVEGLLGKKIALEYALSAGDDYELALVVPEEKSQEMEVEFTRLGLPFYCIGSVTQGLGVVCKDAKGKEKVSSLSGYKHF